MTAERPEAGDQGTHRFLGYWLVLGAAACWATGGLLARWLFVGDVLDISPVDLAASRAVVSALLLGGWMLLRRRESLRVRRQDLLFILVFGVIGQALVHLAYYEAIAWAGVATAILLEYLALIIVLVVSVMFMGERATLALPVAVALAVTGCALVVGVIGSEGGLHVPVEGIAWGLAAAAAYSTYMLMGRRAAGRIDSWTLLTWGLIVAAGFWLVAVGPVRIVDTLSDPARLAAVGYVAVVSTIVPFGIFLIALKHIDATRAGVTATIEPVLAGALAWMVLAEALDAWQVVGALLVLAAIVLVQLPARRMTRLPPVT